MKEIWKPIKDYEGYYEVSNLGNIRSLRRNNLIIKPYKNHRGYLMVNLWHKCKQDKRLISRLVAQAFIQNENCYPNVNHIDGNRVNNNVNNLEWCTQSQNVKHAYDTGLKTNLNKKISDEQVKEIIKLRENKVPLTNIASKYNISISLVSMLYNGKRRKKVV